MSVLYFLESIRNPVLDFLMLSVTKLGEELIFMLIAVCVLWCVDKYKGYYLLFVGFFGIQINQFLKVHFKVPRPWIKDPDFTVVDGAKAEATGFSFPSGHTQTSVGAYGAIFAFTKKKWLKYLTAAFCILVPVSRMYLGVHTLLDVGVSFLIAIFLLFIFGIIMKKTANSKKGMRIFLSVMTLITFIATIYMTLRFKGDTEPQVTDAVENFYKMLGAALGMIMAFEIDSRYVKFTTHARWWVQIIKVVSGLAVILGIKFLGYLLLSPLMWLPLAKGITYLLIVVTAGALWPITFKYFEKL